MVLSVQSLSICPLIFYSSSGCMMNRALLVHFLSLHEYRAADLFLSYTYLSKSTACFNQCYKSCFRKLFPKTVNFCSVWEVTFNWVHSRTAATQWLGYNTRYVNCICSGTMHTVYTLPVSSGRPDTQLAKRHKQHLHKRKITQNTCRWQKHWEQFTNET
jgi:hypothetical protein